METEKPAGVDKHRERVIAAATKLLAEGGREAVSTRAVSTAAGTQAPTIYRLFGDKQGLLDAVAAHGWAQHLEEEAAIRPTGDPVEDLRTGWELNIAFALANPALYCLMYGEPRPGGAASPAAAAAFAHLSSYIRSVAQAGRLRVGEERAARLVQAAGSGTALALIATAEDQRDLTLSDLAREAVIAAITTGPPTEGSPGQEPPGPAGAAVTLRAVLPQTSALTANERGLLEDWLDRIAGERP
ncbi:TetR family transcriptional regulator [Kitasatospora sp. NE20-6]|uniref:TetR/AcrR family transcriptional regulator n=1 Tax=Kitasatospora sp. NE20-6 TaxID=2859066 RepID=UPI0034DC95B8